jgi:hypothetical protein
MTDPEQDDVFDAYLKRRAVLPALDDKLEPPAALDEAVLAKARAAIQPAGGSRMAAGAGAGPIAATDTRRTSGGPPNGSTKLPTGRPPRWAVPVALAATVLLCLSVVMNISLNTNRPSPNLQRAAAARADSKASALSNATAESNTAAGVDAASSGAAHDRFADNGERPQSVSGEIASREVVLPQAKVAGVAAPRAPVVVESATASAPTASAPTASAPTAPALTANAQTAPAPAASAVAANPLTANASTTAASTAPAPTTPAMAAKEVAANAPTLPSVAANAAGNLTPTPSASAAFASTNSESRIASPYTTPVSPGGSSSGAGNVTDAGATQPTANGPRVSEDKAVLMAKRARVAAPDYTPAPEASRAAGQSVAMREAVMARAADSAAPTSEGAAVPARQAAAKSEAPEMSARAAGQPAAKSAPAAAAHPVDPKVWLQQISDLRAAGKADQADAEMRRFKAAFPDYAIPAAAAAPAPPAPAASAAPPAPPPH